MKLYEATFGMRLYLGVRLFMGKCSIFQNEGMITIWCLFHKSTWSCTLCHFDISHFHGTSRCIMNLHEIWWINRSFFNLWQIYLTRFTQGILHFLYNMWQSINTVSQPSFLSIFHEDSWTLSAGCLGMYWDIAVKSGCSCLNGQFTVGDYHDYRNFNTEWHQYVNYHRF